MPPRHSPRALDPHPVLTLAAGGVDVGVANAEQERAEKEAIVQFKHALRLDPNNDTFWVALGNATFLSQPAICQHSYVRALEIDGKVS